MLDFLAAPDTGVSPSANKHCTDPAFAELLDGQRAQLLPIRWRANLNLEGGSIDRTGDQDAENLDNKFTIGDVSPAY